MPTTELRVRYFASLVDRTGVRTETFPLSVPMNVEGLWRALQSRHPELGSVSPRPLVACDREWSSWDRSLDGVAEVAFLPPVSGG